MWTYFNTICRELNLGELQNLTQINGGKTNRMFKIDTTHGIYAIKVLSQSNIESSRKTLVNIEISEYISNQAKNNGVNAISAIKYNDTYIQKINQNYLLIYDWYNGTMPYNYDMTQQDIKNIARQLALLHKVKIFKNGKPRLNTKIDFEQYLKPLLNSNQEWSSYILKKFENLTNCYNKSWKSYEKLSDQHSFVHGDLNSKNILLDGNNVWLLDWETAKIGNPSLDFFYTSCFGIGDYNDENYNTFAKEYLSSNNLLDDIEISSYATLTEEFAWLELCLRRGLEIQTSDDEEINIGKDSSIRSLDRILECYDRIPEMIQIVKNARKVIDEEKKQDLDQR